MGGKFLFAESSKNLETSGGYAKELDAEDKIKQEELLKNTIKNQDIIICTALIPGKKAPRIITEEMVKSMKNGSVICDLAVEQGGNSAFSEPGKLREDGLERRMKMPRKRLGAEQIVTKLRQVEVLQSPGKSIVAACKEAGLTEHLKKFYPTVKLIENMSNRPHG